MKKIITLALMVGLLSIFSPVFAQEDTLIATNPAANGKAGLIVSPVVREVSVSPGQSFDDTVKITNITSKTLTITTEIKDFTAGADESGEPQILDDTALSNYSAKSWVNTVKSFKLGANETMEVDYTINVPSNATPGGHYAALLFTFTNGEVEEGVGAVGKIGPLLLINVTGNEIVSAKIAEFSINKGMFASYEPAEFITRVQNDGNTHVKPTGAITITNAFGKEVASLTVNEDSGNVLPGSVRKFVNEFETKGRFGWYTAKLNLTYGGSSVLQKNITFYVIPWKETAVVVIVLVVLIWLIVNASRKKNA